MRVVVSLAAGVPRSGDLPAGGTRPDARWTAVVVDVLRATSTLTAALANGARAVEPFGDPAQAIARRDAGAGAVLACGERGGRRVPGFDLANSPSEFTRERVAGKTLAFASTNGSIALLETAGCARRILGAFINATAVVEAVRSAPRRPLWIACAGKERRFALEDAAFAGWLIAALAPHGARPEGAGARLALSLAPRDRDDARALVEGSAHGRYLRSISPLHAADVSWCAGLDRLGVAFAV
jgi:2-phosphosulfolactate phosphatase